MAGINKNIFEKITEYALWVVIFSLPFSKSLIEIFMTIAIVSWVLVKASKREFRLNDKKLLTFFLIFIAVNAASVFYSDFFMLSLRAFFSKCLKFMALFFIVSETVNTREKLRGCLKIILASVFLITIDGFIQKYSLGKVDILRNYPIFNQYYPTSSFPFPNDYATWIITLLPLGIALTFFALKSDLKERAIVSLGTVSLFFSLYLTKARGAWAGFFISMVTFGVLKTKKIIIALIALIIVLYAVTPANLKKDIVSTVSFTDRQNIWGTSVRMLKVHPVRGFGINTYFRHYMAYRDDADKGLRGSYAHNCYLQTAVDLGIIGLLAFLALLFRIFQVSIMRIRKIKDVFLNNTAMGIWIGLIGFCVYAFFDTGFYSLPLATLFWFMAGLLYSVINVYEKAI